jgi:chromosome partitioning protein
VRTIAIVNQKGGCGKTTTAINLAGVFAASGFRTLLVDMDPQSHCAAGLAIPEQRIDLHIGDAMASVGARSLDPDRLLWRVSRNLDLAPSTMKLAALEASRGDLAGRIGAETRLARVLENLGGRHDICFIDCSPAIGMLTFNALVAADEVVIPVETGFFSLQGAAKQVSTIRSLGKRLGLTPAYRLLATMHDAESVLARELLDELRRRFQGKVIPQVIRYDQRLREAASFGQPVIEYAPESSGAADYTALAQWLVENRAAAGQRRAACDEDTLDADAEATVPLGAHDRAEEHESEVVSLPREGALPWTDESSRAVGIPA